MYNFLFYKYAIGKYVFTKEYIDCAFIHLCVNVANFALHLYCYRKYKTFCELLLQI